MQQPCSSFCLHTLVNAAPQLRFLWATEVWRHFCHCCCFFLKTGTFRSGTTGEMTNIAQGSHQLNPKTSGRKHTQKACSTSQCLKPSVSPWQVTFVTLDDYRWMALCARIQGLLWSLSERKMPHKKVRLTLETKFSAKARFWPRDIYLMFKTVWLRLNDTWLKSYTKSPVLMSYCTHSQATQSVCFELTSGHHGKCPQSSIAASACHTFTLLQHRPMARTFRELPLFPVSFWTV